MLSGDRAGLIDRWIYVITATLFVAAVLTGFLPDSAEKIALVQTGKRAPFPLVLHLHAILMGSYLLLLLAQTVLVATGRAALHRTLGLAAMAIAPAMVLVGFLLIPTMYHQGLAALRTAPAAARPEILGGLGFAENIMLVQGRIGFMFAILVALGLAARKTDPGFHKRMMILSIAPALPAGFDRIEWLPSTMPASPVAPDLYVLMAIAPMFLWDVLRNRRVHRAYWVWLAVAAPFTLAVHLLWDTPLWHATAKRILGA
ncbi:MAG: hypothetical protein JSR98_22010 [Proteobacteria bacterium]|nr:hypothetical protein [Pseudomonadota bacterium]